MKTFTDLEFSISARLNTRVEELVTYDRMSPDMARGVAVREMQSDLRAAMEPKLEPVKVDPRTVRYTIGDSRCHVCDAPCGGRKYCGLRCKWRAAYARRSREGRAA